MCTIFLFTSIIQPDVTADEQKDSGMEDNSCVQSILNLP